MAAKDKDIIWKFDEVLSSELYLPNSRTYHPNGSMSEQIFGPIRDYTCQCGIIKQTGERCPNCGVRWIKSDSRDTATSIIKFPFRIIAPQLFYLLLKLDPSIQKELETYKLDMQRVYDLVDSIKNDAYDGPKTQKYYAVKRMIEAHPDFCDVRELVVIPPNLRPVTGGAKKYLSDELNHAYQSILEKIIAYNESTVKKPYHVAIIQKTLYESIYLQEIINKISTKEGYIRQNILGKRVDFSGRTVITPNNELPSSIIEVPYLILIDLFEPYIYYKYPNPIRAMDDLSQARETGEISDKLKQVVNIICYEDKIPVVINRQPTLHRQSMRAYFPIPTEKKAISINPIIVDGFNADFDGDQMAIYAPLIQEEIKEFAEKFINHRNQIQHGSLQFSSISQFSYSVYQMSRDNPNPDNVAFEIANQINLKDLEEYFFENINDYSATVKITLDDSVHYTTCGRLFLTLYLQENIDYPMNKSKFNSVVTNKLLRILTTRHLEYSDIEFVDTLLHTHLLNIPITISIRTLCDVFSNDDYLELSKELQTTKSIKKTKELEEKMTQYLKNSDDMKPMLNIIRSGAKGGFSSIKQMCVSKGYVVDALNQKISYYISRNFIQGLSYNDMYYMSFGTRKGSLDRSVSTATTGYFMRKLVFAIQDAVVDYSVDDCGVEPILKIELTEENYKAYLMNYFKVEGSDELILLTVDNYKDYVGKVILVRSPINCKNKEGFCKKCYGKFEYLFTESPNVGIIAAQALGERATQLVMRVFHTGGVVSDARDEINKDYLIEVTDDFIVQKEFVVESIDFDEYIIDEELIQDLYITTTEGIELFIPKGSLMHIKLKPEQKITKNTKLFTLPKSQAKSITNIFDSVVEAIEQPNKSVKNWESLYQLLLDSFYYTEGIISKHLEVLVAQMMRDPLTKEPARLHDIDDYILLSTKKLPLLRTILTFGYQNFHSNLIKSLVEANTDAKLSILEKLIIGVNKKNLGFNKNITD